MKSIVKCICVSALISAMFAACAQSDVKTDNSQANSESATSKNQEIIPESEKPVKPLINLMDAATIDTCDGVFEGYWDEKVNDKITCSVNLKVIVENCRVTAITITDSTWLHREAAMKIPREIIESQSLPVDAVSGASVASWTIMTATAVALGIDLIELEDSATE